MMWSMVRFAVVVSITIFFLPECGDIQKAASPDQRAMKQKLEQLREGSASPDGLEVVYSDMHAFHGGETLTVKGDMLTGKYLIRQGVSPEQIEPPPRKMTAQQLHTLVELLLEIEAWEQRVPERTPVPDESRASLSIKVGELQSSIWEWFNDLSGNDRMVKVKHLLKEIAGPVPD